MNDGALLAHRLRAFINEFSTRSDVYVHERSYGHPIHQKELDSMRKRLPAELAELSAAMCGTRFIWDLADRRDEDLSPGVHGGRLRLVQHWSKSKFLRADPGYGFDKDTHFLIVDEHINEGMTFLTYRKGEDPPQWRYVFGRAGEEGEATFVASSLAGYLERAMKHWFTWYWPDGSAEGTSTMEYLHANPARPRPIFEVKVNECEPLSRAEMRRRQILRGAPKRDVGKALKKLGVAFGKKESKEALAEKLVEHVIAMDALDDAAAEAIFDIVDYGVSITAPEVFRTKDVAVKRAHLAEYLAFDEEPLVRALLCVRAVSPLPEGMPGDPLGLICLLLAQAPGGRVEDAIPHAKLWDYIYPAPRWPERRKLLRAVWQPEMLVSSDDFRSEIVTVELALPRALLPELAAGSAWQATAVTR